VSFRAETDDEDFVSPKSGSLTTKEAVIANGTSLHDD